MSIRTSPAAPHFGAFERRSFWTKRKKTATSLLTILALIAGIAVAFKLFEQEVPNNVVRDASTFDFSVFKFDEEVGDNDFEIADATNPIFSDTAGIFPGDTRTVEVKIQNENENPAKDASFEVYVSRIEVTDENGAVVLLDDPRAVRFLNFFTFAAEKEKVLTEDVLGTDIANEDDHTGQNLLQPNGDPDDSGFRQYDDACEAAGLKTYVKQAPCKLGMIRAAGSRDDLGEQTDVRYYLFHVTEADDGTDQSEFKNWAVTFDFTFSARVPAEPESGFIVRER